ncbi:MAG: type IV pilus twitching motility protein PilT [Patescibacteria group bacterium]|jgi:twitching motility protein PilT
MSLGNTEHIDSILALAASSGASDAHFIVGRQPVFRIDGNLVDVEQETALTPASMEELVYSVITPEQKERFLEQRELDFAYQVKRDARFRVNIHWARNNIGMVARVIPVTLPTMQQLDVPEVMYDLLNLHQGLILVTGPTGCGKSSTLAAMINHINQTRRAHIVTLEDPIEYVFFSNQCIIRQRELYKDFLSFGTALKHVVRQDPDIIMVGEMRDLETISAALTVAETGHLVLATLHTLGSSQTIDRIIDVFPPYQQEQIRLQLSTELRAVMSQRLIPRIGGGRVAVREVLINTPAVANLIRENKITQIQTVMQTSSASHMNTLDQDLKRLYEEREINRETALAYVEHKELLE